MARTIFVADDHVDSAETTADLLRMEGYDVRVFFNGKQAVDAARRSWPTMVVLDINMPVMDGYEAAAILRREGPPSLILVALTGRTQYADLERARRAGFNRHLGKPVVGDALCVLARTCFLDLEHVRLKEEHPSNLQEQAPSASEQADDVADER